MLCEDDELLRIVLRKLLCEHGHEIVAETGAADRATVLLRRDRPDAVIVDWALERGSGREVIAEAHQIGCTPIVFSAFADDLELPGVTVVAKPDFSALVREVDALEARKTAQPWRPGAPDRRTSRSERSLPSTRGIDDTANFFRTLAEAESSDALVAIRPDHDASESNSDVAAALRSIVRTTDRVTQNAHEVLALLIDAGVDGGNAVIDRLRTIAGGEAVRRAEHVTLGEVTSPADAYRLVRANGLDLGNGTAAAASSEPADVVERNGSANGGRIRSAPPETSTRVATDDRRDERKRRARKKADRAARERAAREQAERERAERQAAEQAERDEAERRAAEQAEREQAERRAAEQAEREQAERRAAEQAERERAEREQAERERAEREQAEREQAERRAAEQAEREQAQRERAEREQAEREQAEREQAERRAAEQRARDEAEREVADAAVVFHDEPAPIGTPAIAPAVEAPVEPAVAASPTREAPVGLAALVLRTFGEDFSGDLLAFADRVEWWDRPTLGSDARIGSLPYDEVKSVHVERETLLYSRVAFTSMDRTTSFRLRHADARQLTNFLADR